MAGLKEHEGLTEDELRTADLGIEPYRKNRLWHMDMSDAECPPEVSAVYMVQPSGKDDTLFARCVSFIHTLACCSNTDLLISYSLAVYAFAGKDQAQAVCTCCWQYV